MLRQIAQQKTPPFLGAGCRLAICVWFTLSRSAPARGANKNYAKKQAAEDRRAQRKARFRRRKTGQQGVHDETRFEFDAVLKPQD
jgi:hypothetical protein